MTPTDKQESRCTCGQSGHGNGHDPGCPRSNYQPVKSARQEAEVVRRQAVDKQEGEEVAHPLSCLPDCMMPDGAEPCAGYQTLDKAYNAERQKVTVLAAKLSDSAIEIAALTRQLAEAREVTEAMVEAGAAGMYGKDWNNPDPQKRPGDKMKDVWRRLSRDALTAALNPSPPPREQLENRDEGVAS